MSAVTNISTYLFAPLSGLESLREELLASCKGWGLKGTILLSEEGINMFVAGEAESIDRLLEKLRAIPGLEGLTPKVSLSDDQPFNRMLVRVKKEIISFGVEAVRPADYTSPKIAPKELKKWLDEGKPVTLLDTRNDYEVKLGTFKGAVDPNIKTFRGFPEAVRKLPEEMKDQPVVMFCTGGIRCEKAGPFMELEGFKNIYQLDGGILKYFEECGGEHYEGDCFVFDQRVGVDPGLGESDHAICFACLKPLSTEEQLDPRYVQGKSCPHCHVDEAEKLAERVASRQAKLDAQCDPLPGSVLQENRRVVTIPARLDRRELLDALADLLPQVSAAELEGWCKAGRFVNYSGVARGRDHIVRAGERVIQVFPPEIEPEVSTDIRVLYEDDALIVVRKPAPLPMAEFGPFHRNTLQYLMNQACELPRVPRAVNRLETMMSGLVVFARTRNFCRVLMDRFDGGDAVKVYLVSVKGHPENDRFFTDSPVVAETGSKDDEELLVLESRTDFQVLERRGDGTALLEAVARSGGTNQIRIHLERLGFPIVGDEDGRVDECRTFGEAPPLRLHLWKLSFQHPSTGEALQFEAECPKWA
ncbi:sulfurtransferase [Haloferula chungangensis]|uniref:tRNA uridine(34) hydroxylase n=1 Tax=Haloferula chungangensis TaxID=1048331 RepID=A0ABW2L7E6_9BACT